MLDFPRLHLIVVICLSFSASVARCCRNVVCLQQNRKMRANRIQQDDGYGALFQWNRRAVRQILSSTALENECLW
ncbi:hypothetical protein Y032_0191g1311 [Ancylostoma ceylanicum]|uniref:Secreted protein n=1 Tax=Ancylostoma ceylanicum TaxID=53326 RepID=A0A016SPR6_9BILA|nr:hypothetical protein Y032_0191g1311 [Ancylostoma ceylanicum]